MLVQAVPVVCCQPSSYRLPSGWNACLFMRQRSQAWSLWGQCSCFCSKFCSIRATSDFGQTGAELMTLSGHPASQPWEKKSTSFPDPGQLTHLRYAREKLCDVKLTQSQGHLALPDRTVQDTENTQPFSLSLKLEPVSLWLERAHQTLPEAQAGQASSSSFRYARLSIYI